MCIAKDISFYSSEKYKKKPSESQAHVHITKPEAGSEYLSVKQTLHKNFPETLSESPAKKTSLKTKFIGPRQFSEPDNASDYRIQEYEVKSNIERNNEWIKLHGR